MQPASDIDGDRAGYLMQQYVAQEGSVLSPTLGRRRAQHRVFCFVKANGNADFPVEGRMRSAGHGYGLSTDEMDGGVAATESAGCR